MTAATMPKASRAVGAPTPRIAPPTPAKSEWKALQAQYLELGITPFPWQLTSARYTEALGPGGTWLYREVADIVGRQNGKTEKLVPHIVRRLRMGRRVMHTAQNRELPREVFGRVAEAIERLYPDLMMRRRGRIIAPRFSNGQEEIRLTNGAHYRIVAPTRGGARGPSVDDLIIDEVRELTDHDFIAAAEPTLAASANPQTLYLSSAGWEESAVLNGIRLRAGVDPSLAWLEWSAAPGRRADDVAGWLEANPAVGHIPAKLAWLESAYRKHKLEGTLGIFEAEYLARWVATVRELLVDVEAWASLRTNDLGRSHRAFMGFAYDPGGSRASVAKAWKLPDGSIALKMLLEATGSPINADKLGKDLRAIAAAEGIIETGIDPLTDATFAKYLRVAKPIASRLHADASARFVNAVSGGTLHWAEADSVTDDLTWTSRKPHDESGSFQAVRADDDRPITAALAAIRAVWLASGPGGGQARIW